MKTPEKPETTTEEKRGKDERIQDLLRNGDLKKFDRDLEETNRPPKKKP
jgi:hypothetical protein